MRGISGFCLFLISGLVSLAQAQDFIPDLGLKPSAFPGVGESHELYPGGPLVTRDKDTLEVNFGSSRREGFMRATYNADSSLRLVETFNPRGLRISWTNYGLPSGQIETSFDLGE